MDVFIYFIIFVAAVALVENIGFGRGGSEDDIGYARRHAKLVASIVIGALLFWYQGANILFLTLGIIIFDSVARFYTKGEGVLYAIAAELYVFSSLYYASPYLIAQAALLGFVASMRFGKPYRVETGSEGEKEREVNRDIIQIIAGILVIFVIYYMQQANSYIDIIGFMVAGYVILGYVSRGYGRLSAGLKKLERDYAKFGEGAMWLGMGTLFAIAFLHNLMYIIAVMFAIYISDSLATIVGIKAGGRTLTYNRKKRLSGLLAYFIPLAIVMFYIVGAIGIIAAFIAAMIESIDTGMDDNITVSIFLTLMLILI